MKPPRLSSAQINALFGLQLLYSETHRAYCERTYLAPGEAGRLTLFAKLVFAPHRGSSARPMTKTFVWDHADGFGELIGIDASGYAVLGQDADAVIDAPATSVRALTAETSL